jgi:hypothetical protein
MERLLAGLRLPDFENWFKSQFGADAGQRAAEEYKPFHDDIGFLGEVLATLAKDKDVVEVARVEHGNDADGVGYQKLALKAMAKKTPLYSVRFRGAKDKGAYHLWSFVYAGGSFRYVGKMRRAVTSGDLPDNDPGEWKSEPAPAPESPPPP